MIAIIDTGGANIASLQIALRRLNAESVLTSDSDLIKKSDRVILPGVGTAQACMKRIDDFNLKNTIRQLTQPVLGVCLGMQILFEYSAEGDTATLGIISGKVDKIPSQSGFPVPHMGWNNLVLNAPSPLTKDLTAEDYFYFVHSFFAPQVANTVAVANYSIP
ncbi:MAG: imidazole glycerol phosphate synthase subunit HisH, partial [Pseudobdellovibrionaceae bacterium]